jgi:hypothetical protein
VLARFEAEELAGAEAVELTEFEAGGLARLEAGELAGFEPGELDGELARFKADEVAVLEARELAWLEAGELAGFEAGELAGLEAGELAGFEAGEFVWLEAGEFVWLEAGELAGLEAGALVGLETPIRLDEVDKEAVELATLRNPVLEDPDFELLIDPAPLEAAVDEGDTDDGDNEVAEDPGGIVLEKLAPGILDEAAPLDDPDTAGELEGPLADADPIEEPERLDTTVFELAADWLELGAVTELLLIELDEPEFTTLALFNEP